MKKIISIVAVAAVALCFAAKANAQLGVVAGFTSSSTNLDVQNFDTKSVSLFHVGVAYKLELGMGLAIQPELLYQMKGAELTIGDTAKETIANVAGSLETKTGYLELPVEIQWGLDLGIAKPYVFVAPFVGYAVTTKELSEGTVQVLGLALTSNPEPVTSWAESAKNRLEYGIGGGLGVELLGRLQISAQYFQNLGRLYKEGNIQSADAISSAIQNTVKEKNYGGLKISAALFF